MQNLTPMDTFPYNHFIILWFADWASMLCAPQKVESTSITGSVRAFGGQINCAIAILFVVTPQRYDGCTTFLTCRGGTERVTRR